MASGPTTSIRRVTTLEVGVPDPDATAAFFVDGLDFVRVDAPDGRVSLTVEGEYGIGTPPAVLTLRASDELALDALVMEVSDAEGLADVVRRLEEAGQACERAADDEIRFEVPRGIPVRCLIAPVRDRAPLPPSAVRPRRLGHVNVKVPDAVETRDFFVDVLGFGLSEQVGDLLMFLRTASDHHNIGLRGGEERANVHHIAMEVPGWDSFLVICDYLASKGHVVEYGPGRHGPGHNLFVYLREPDSGLRMELFADMAHIDDPVGYQPHLWKPEDRARTLNQWGPGPPPSFFE